MIEIPESSDWLCNAPILSLLSSLFPGPAHTVFPAPFFSLLPLLPDLTLAGEKGFQFAGHNGRRSPRGRSPILQR